MEFDILVSDCGHADRSSVPLVGVNPNPMRSLPRRSVVSSYCPRLCRTFPRDAFVFQILLVLEVEPVINFRGPELGIETSKLFEWLVTYVEISGVLACVVAVS